MWKRLWHEEEGQSLVMMALLLSILLGFTALVVDVGYLYAEKRQMQTAVDAAALAGAQDLPYQSQAVSQAQTYVTSNIQQANPIITTPYQSNSKLLAVSATKEVSTFFARVLGIDTVTIAADAVAQKVDRWRGEALPFINLDDNYATNPNINLWEKTGPGDFESLWKDDFDTIKIYVNEEGKKNNGNLNNVELVYFNVKYEDGIDITKGVVANIKQELDMVARPGAMAYVFSLRSDVVESGKYSNLGGTNLTNKMTIPLEDMVLLQVKIIDYELKNNDGRLKMEYVKAFDIVNGEYPTEFIQNTERGTSKLIK